MSKTHSKETKQKARNLRGNGWTLGEISQKFKISNNTISGWVKDIKLSNKQKERIKQKIVDSGKIGRLLAVAANRRKIEQWKENIRGSVKYFENISLKNPKLGKLI